ncbi:ABC transporter substrate-binding protein [Pseudaminobacter arsenicus]|uniref:Thiamine pyrimidine synthase n=1 Tax=Borborobacter arsenicus TaxID=1851146 RepID=A0A432V7H3_9HYPH|nr:ABC transporter substrate-binding protein [Pseudaminobacter arsenicus]RUM98105.1 ABC transporter substrate-binding protein [Pseudaminobacter arsenicus]
MDQFRVSATGHSLNYLPEYLANSEGIFAKHGLSVSVSVPQPWPKVLEDINSGQAHAALGGIWVPSMYFRRVENYMAFAQISERCPLSILGRKPGNFTLNNLEGATVLVAGGTGPSPFLFLSGLMAEAGVDRNRVRIVHDLTTPMLVELFMGGMGDYLAVDPLTAGRLVEDRRAVLVGCLSEIGAAVPWSVYYTLPDRLAREAEFFVRFSMAIDESMALLRSAPINEVSSLLSRLWPSASSSVLTTVATRFQANGMWATGSRIQPGPFDRWQGMIADHGLVERPLAMAEIVHGVV